jgi:heme/copper-type cytochrome/quinol oxidase subunit 2
MFSREIFDLLIQVVTSWQVIAVTVAVVLYIFLVSYVARLYHRPRSVSIFPSKPKKVKEKKAAAAEGPEVSTNDELGLEEK